MPIFYLADPTILSLTEPLHTFDGGAAKGGISRQEANPVHCRLTGCSGASDVSRHPGHPPRRTPMRAADETDLIGDFP